MESLGAANIHLGLDLLKELKKTNDGNIFFSPVGISTAIGMLLLGTRGPTASQLRKVGGFLCFSCTACFWGPAFEHDLENMLILTCEPGNKTCEDREEFQVCQGRSLPSPNAITPSAPRCLTFLWVVVGGGCVSGLSEVTALIIKDRT